MDPAIQVSEKALLFNLTVGLEDEQRRKFVPEIKAKKLEVQSAYLYSSTNLIHFTADDFSVPGGRRQKGRVISYGPAPHVIQCRRNDLSELLVRLFRCICRCVATRWTIKSRDEGKTRVHTSRHSISYYHS